MVHLETSEAQEKYYNKNLDRYVKEHSEEFVVIEGGSEQFKETFFKRKENLSEYLKKYGGQYEPTFFVKEIPHQSLVSKLETSRRHGLFGDKEGLVI